MTTNVLYEGSEGNLHECEKNFTKLGLSLSEVKQVIADAKSASEKACAPYSHYAVGAAGVFESKEGEFLFIDGANQENAAYSPGQCAETVAIARARAEGHHTIRLMAVYGMPDSSTPETVRKTAAKQWVAPCGRCRQVINETVADNCLIISVRGDGQIMVIAFADLFPFAFGPHNLGIDPSSYQS